MTCPLRIQRSRAKGWRMPDGAVYVGRGSMWGNPYRVANVQVESRGELSNVLAVEDVRDGSIVQTHFLSVRAATEWAVFRYRTEISAALLLPDVAATADPDAHWRAQHLPEIAGKPLACWCKLSHPCHADALLDLANAAQPPEATAERALPAPAGARPAREAQS